MVVGSNKSSKGGLLSVMLGASYSKYFQDSFSVSMKVLGVSLDYNESKHSSMDCVNIELYSFTGVHDSIYEKQKNVLRGKALTILRSYF